MGLRLVVVCFLLFSTSLADREYYEEDTFAQLTEDLMKEIKKRISDSKSEDVSTDLMLDSINECEHDYGLTTAVDVIIKTHDSIAQGAEFIESPESATRDDCVQTCCDDDNCNVAVFKDQGDKHSCYLFDCGPPGTCLFTNHTGFSVVQLSHKRTAKVQGLNHEEDLVKLADVTSTTTTTTTTTATARPTELVGKPVPLFGECTHDKDCAGSKTVCQVNYCVCQDNYHAQDGECRKDCSRFEFECANSGQPLTYPQCVALYDTCDGIEHCSDGSDERDCPASPGQDLPALGSGPVVQSYLPIEQQQQQALASLQQQQLAAAAAAQGYSFHPASGLPQPGLSLQQQIQSLGMPQPQLPSVPQPQLQQSYVNLQPQPKPQQLQHPIDATSSQQQQQLLQPQQVYSNPVAQQLQPQALLKPQSQQQQAPVQQQAYLGLLQPQQQHLQLQQQQPQQQQQQSQQQQQLLQQQPAFNKNSQGQQQVAPDQQQAASQMPQQQQQLPAAQPVQDQILVNSGEQFYGIQQGSYHHVDRKPGPAYKALPPPEQERPAGGTGHVAGRPDVGHGQVGRPSKAKVQDTDMDHSDVGDTADKTGDQAIKVKVQPVPPAKSRKQPEHSVESDGKTGGVTGGDPTSGSGVPKQAGGQVGNGRGGSRGQYTTGHGGGYVDSGYIRGNGHDYNSPSDQFAPTRWDGGKDRPGTPFRSDSSKQNYGKPATGYHPQGPVYSDYDNYDYGGGLTYGGGFGPDYNYRYYLQEPGLPSGTGYGSIYKEYPPSSWDAHQAYLSAGNLWNEPPNPASKAGKSHPEEHKEKWDDNDSQYKHQDSEQSDTDEHNGDWDDNDSKDKHQKDGHNSNGRWDDDDSKLKQGDSDETKSTDKSTEKTSDDSDSKEEADKHSQETIQVSQEQGESEEQASREPVKQHPDVEPHLELPDDNSQSQLGKEEKEEPNEESVAQSNQGAVIALALGLSITALLLVFVGCRLRSVKRRLRRGRPLNSNEADYLVNGMYL